MCSGEQGRSVCSQAGCAGGVCRALAIITVLTVQGQSLWSKVVNWVKWIRETAEQNGSGGPISISSWDYPSCFLCFLCDGPWAVLSGESVAKLPPSWPSLIRLVFPAQKQEAKQNSTDSAFPPGTASVFPRQNLSFTM